MREIEQARNTMFGLYDMFSGGNLSRVTIFALGIMPYISASIILQLLTVVWPYLEKLSKEGEMGRKAEFLLQEIGREVNTIGSKSNDIAIAQDVIELKSELAKLNAKAGLGPQQVSQHLLPFGLVDGAAGAAEAAAQHGKQGADAGAGGFQIWIADDDEPCLFDCGEQFGSGPEFEMFGQV